MSIATKTGDDGKTSLYSGTRVSKTDLRIEALGSLDELNSQMGMAVSLCEKEHHEIIEYLLGIQNVLFNVGALVAGSTVEPPKVENLEAHILKLEEELPPLREFILPGGHPAASAAHMARSICRRAERSIAALDQVHPKVLPYINRLSDDLFLTARLINYKVGLHEPLWQKS